MNGTATRRPTRPLTRRPTPLAGVAEARRWVASDRAADAAFKVACGISAVVFYVVGRHQWFIRDDFAFLITRNVVRSQRGLAAWLLTPQDGHWMTPPILVYRAVQNVFGIDSYWPFLLPTMAVHVVTVLLVRAICRRCGASAWTTTLMCSALLVFGSGWENIVFGIQITYNLSLAAFLAVLLLIDHDGPPDRRDVIASVVGLLGVMSSGFGPFFIAGAAILLALRRRWLAGLIVVGPQALAFGWWFLAWYADPIAERVTGPRSLVPAFAARGITATFEGLIAIASLTGLALLAAVAVTLWPGTLTPVRRLLGTLWLTALLVFLGVGYTRIGFGVDSAAVSRYRYVGAMLLAPALVVAIDTLGRWSATAVAASRAVLVTSVVLNAGWLHTSGAEWAIRARGAQDVYALVAGSGLAEQADQNVRPEEYNPDVTLRWLPWLVEEGAVIPRAPATAAEVDKVRAVLKLPPVATP